MVQTSRSNLWIITVLFLLLHSGFLVQGFSNPESFMAGDRAATRLEKIRYVFLGDSHRPDADAVSVQAPTDLSPGVFSLKARLIETGTPGDYAIHGVFYRLGGEFGVIVVQLVCWYIALLCLYQLALLIGCSARFALLAVILYMILPGSLIYPHELASESLYNPLTLIGMYALCSHRESGFRYWKLLLGVSLLALAIALRFQLVLYPFVLAMVIAVYDRQRRIPQIALICAISFLIPISWALFVKSQTGEARIKSSDNDVALEFYKTAQRVSSVGNFEFDETNYPDHTMGVSEFVGFISKHPTAYLRLKALHVVNLAANPGIYSLMGHHLNLLEGAGDKQYWQQLRNREGYGGVLREIIQRGPGLAITIALSLVAWCLFLLMAVLGFFIFLRNPIPMKGTKAVLLSFAIYSCVIVQVSNDVRWGHRTPIEFFLAILCVIALERISQRRKRGDLNENLSQAVEATPTSVPSS